MAFRLVADQPRRPILSGDGAPAGALGIDGDVYIDRTGHTFYDKVSGAWVSRFDMQGPAGSAGSGGGWPLSTDQVWYVSGTGNDTTGDGRSWATAYRTIQKAHDTASGSAVIYVGFGTFDPFVMTKNGLRITGAGAGTGTSGTRIQPLTDTDTLVKFDECSNSVMENIQLRNQSRANWHGVFVHFNNGSFNILRNVPYVNNTSTCPVTDGIRGGTGELYTRGEGNRVYDWFASGLHLIRHIGREASLPMVINGQGSGCYRSLVIDSDAGAIYDDYTDIVKHPFMAGSTAIMNASSGQLAAIATGSAATLRLDVLINGQGGAWYPHDGRESGKITLAANGSFTVTARGLYVTPTVSPTGQNPVDGGQLTWTTVAGMPTSGLIFREEMEVISYTGITGNATTGITRALAGTTNQGTYNTGHLFQIPTGESLGFRVGAANIEIGTLAADGTFTSLASAAHGQTAGATVYYDAEYEQDDLRLTIYAADPWNPGDPHWLFGTPLATVTHTLTGANKTKFGAGIRGFMGHRMVVGASTAWRVDDTRIRGYGGLPSGGGLFVRYKDTNNPANKKRNDATTINTATNPAVKRWDYYVHAQKSDSAINNGGTGNNHWQIIDLAEGSNANEMYWGGDDELYDGCVAGITAYYAGDRCEFHSVQVDRTVGRLLGNQNDLYKCKVADFQDLGIANNWHNANHLSSFPDRTTHASTVFATTTGEFMVDRKQPAAFRVPVGGFARHALAAGASADVLVVPYNAGVSNGYMTLIDVGNQRRLGWDQVGFEITTAGAAAQLAYAYLFTLNPYDMMATPVAGETLPHPSSLGNVNIGSTGEKTITFTEITTTARLVGVLLWVGSGAGSPAFRALRSSVGSRGPWGQPAGSAVNSGPSIFQRYSLTGTTAGDVPTFDALTDVGPIVRLRRSS